MKPVHFNDACSAISHFTEILSFTESFLWPHPLLNSLVPVMQNIYPKACHTVSLESDLVGFC